MESAKPTVQCSLALPAIHLQIGGSALLLPSDHPNHLPGHAVSNRSVVRTSKIVALDLEARRLETANTIYQWSESEAQ